MGAKFPISYRWFSKNKIRFIEIEPEIHMVNIHNIDNKINFKLGFKSDKYVTSIVKLTSNWGKGVEFADLDKNLYQSEYSIEIMQILHLHPKMNLNFSLTTSFPRKRNFQMLGIMLGMDFYI